MRLIYPVLAAGLLLGAMAVPASSGDPIAAAVANPQRSDMDRQRDKRSHPEETLNLLGVASGDSVIDLFAGGGYYTELLSYVVGEEGAVAAFNNPPYTAFSGKELDGRLADGRLPNVSVYEAKVAAFNPGTARFDSALMILSFHDLYWTSETYDWPAMDAGAFLDAVHDALKPGGRVLVVDHAAQDRVGANQVPALHRIEEAFVVEQFAAHGFKPVASSNVLRNSEDPRNIPMSDESVRGHTDRFVRVFARN